jgi:ribosomal-protein-alanine N-acetyltransferase
MALFRLGSPVESPHLVRGNGVYLRPGQMRDFEQWASLRERSREFLAPWEPTWAPDDLTRLAFRRRIRRNNEEIERDETYPLFIFRAEDSVLLGGLTLGQIRRGVSQTGTIGYWMGAEHAGKGYMARAVRALLAAAFSSSVFGSSRLHRVEAACIPRNEASLRLLKACGFQQEGYARSYLRINGSWEDHVLFAILDSDPAQQRPVSAG